MKKLNAFFHLLVSQKSIISQYYTQFYTQFYISFLNVFFSTEFQIVDSLSNMT